MLETIIGIGIISCILAILLGMPFMLTLITKWENDPNHWWSITNKHVVFDGFRWNLFKIFSGLYFFYFIYAFVTEPDSFKLESDRDYFIYGVTVFAFIAVYGGAIIKSANARKHVLICGLILAIAMIVLIQNYAFSWLIHILVFLISIFLGYKLVLIEAYEQRTK